MGNRSMSNELVVSVQQDFSHDVALVAIVFEVLFCAEIVETIGLPAFSGAIFVNHLKTFGNELEAYFPARFYRIYFLLRLKETKKFH